MNLANRSFFLVLSIFIVLNALPGPCSAKSLIFPAPQVLIPSDLEATPASRRKLIGNYIEKYYQVYVSEFLRLNRLSENKFQKEEVEKKLKAPYLAMSDSKVMQVNESDILVVRAFMDELAFSLYARPELTKFGAASVDLSLAESVSKMSDKLQSYNARMDKQAKELTEISRVLKAQEDSLAKLDSKVRALPVLAGRDLNSSVIKQDLSKSAEAPKSQLPLYMAGLAMLVAVAALFKTMNR